MYGEREDVEGERCAGEDGEGVWVGREEGLGVVDSLLGAYGGDLEGC